MGPSFSDDKMEGLSHVWTPLVLAFGSQHVTNAFVLLTLYKRGQTQSTTMWDPMLSSHNANKHIYWRFWNVTTQVWIISRIKYSNSLFNITEIERCRTSRGIRTNLSIFLYGNSCGEMWKPTVELPYNIMKHVTRLGTFTTSSCFIDLAGYTTILHKHL